MKKLFLVYFLLVSVCFSQGQNNAAQSDSVKITYIANMGFLLESSGKKILIDALFPSGWGYFMEPSPQIRSQIINGDPPFENANLLMITHSDGDHFDSSLTNDYLARNSSRYFLCTSEINGIMTSQQDYHGYESQITVVTPSFFSSIDTNVNNLQIKVLRLRHEGSIGSDQNVGYLIDFNGITVFHSGDNNGYLDASQATSGIMEYSRLGVDTMKIDIAILNFGMLVETTAPGIEIIRNYIKPKHIILGHLTIHDLQGERGRIQNVVRRNQLWLPDVTILENSLESKTYYSSTEPSGVRDENSMPAGIQLYQNYPNPFNPLTILSYSLSTPSHVRLSIHNLLGQEIKILKNNFQNAGEYSVVWNATDDTGKPVSSGIYLYRLETDEKTYQKKMALIR
jgi:L-ascorbate metabolism protein UlaG (beta-lactamase superfamily)